MIRAWKMMGGVDWAALPIVTEILGIEDMELFIVQLLALRDDLADG